MVTVVYTIDPDKFIYSINHAISNQQKTPFACQNLSHISPKQSEQVRQIQKYSLGRRSLEYPTKNNVLFQSNCQLKISKVYESIKLSINSQDTQVVLFYKGKKGKGQKNCSQIQKVCQDGRKIIICFSNETLGNTKDSSNRWETKFIDQASAKQFLWILQKFRINKQKNHAQSNHAQSNHAQTNHTQTNHTQTNHTQTNPILNAMIGIIQKHFKIHQKLGAAKSEVAEWMKANLDKQLKKSKVQNLNPQYEQILATEMTKLTDKLSNQQQKNKIAEQLLQETRKMLENQISQKYLLKLSQREKNQKNEQLLKNIKEIEVSLSKKHQQIEKVKTKVTSQICSYQAKLKNIQNKIMQIIRQNSKLKAQLKCQTQRFKQYQSSVEKKVKNESQLSKQYEDLLKKYENSRRNQQAIQNSAVQLARLQKAYNSMCYLHIFEGPVLQKQFEFKEFLRTEIQTYKKNKIIKTTLLYKYDTKNNVNFHHYIDGHVNLVLIIKTKDGIYLAGFSQSYVKSKQIANKGGLILSLSNFKKFELLKNMRSVTYDDFFIIYGNSQIRLKTQQNKLFSNFGTSNGYYDNLGQPVNTLLGAGTERQTNVQSYQFHQVIFQY